MQRRKSEYIRIASSPAPRVAQPQAQVLLDAKPDRARDLTIFMFGMVTGILELMAVLRFFS